MKNRTINLILLLIFLFVFSANAQDDTKESLKETVKYLSSDEMRGRFPGDIGAEMTVDHMIERFKEYGVKPVGESYKQGFYVTTGVEAGDSNNVYFETLIPRPGLPKERWRKVQRSFVLNEDYVPIAFSEDGEVSGQLAFAGYGISAPELNYDDYEGFDAKDKILVIISDSPDGEDEDSEFKAYSTLRYKATTARNKGAAGIIFVRTDGDSMNVFYRLTYSNFGQNTGVVAVHSNRHSVDKFFPKKQKLFDVEKEIQATRKPNSFVIEDVTAHVKVDLEKVEAETFNVVGLIEGTDKKLKDKHIIVGAHYDHLGFGGPNSRYRGKKELVHNGADDNASGTAMVLELAKKFSENPPRRSIVFMGFSAEEMGLLGSAHYVKEPNVNLDNVAFMMNIDMVGRLRDNKLSVFGVGTAEEFQPLAEKLAEEKGFSLNQSLDGHGSSDHSSFNGAKIPVINLFTGVHEDYHTPADDWDKLNYDGMVEVFDYAYKFIQEIDAQNDEPEYIEVEAPKGKSTKDHSYASVWFGIIPSFDTSDLGCKISGASPGSPAARAGLQENDIITRIDDVEILNLHDFMYKIREHKPGDTLEVELLRGEDYSEKVTVEVTLVAKQK